MKTFIAKLKSYLEENDSWVFFALFFTLSAERAVNTEPHTWGHYLFCLVTLLVCYAPIWFFAHFKARLKNTLLLPSYLLLWGGCFIVWTGLFAWFTRSLLFSYLGFFGDMDYFIMMAFLLPGMDLGLELNRYLNRQSMALNWLKKIGVDGTILISILSISVLFSMMIVSNLTKFQTQEVIYTSIHFGKVISHFFLFLGYTFQFLLLYLSLYFFYILNNKVLIPFLLKKRGLFIYMLGVVGSIALFFPVFAQLLISLPMVKATNSLMPSQTLEVFTELNALIPFIVMICSLPIIVAMQWFRQNNEITHLEKQQVENELGLLKQQINPHFFFNTLNSLYSLSLSKSDKTPEVIVQLSALMRYVIYRGKEKEVLLTEEIDYLTDYINLQKIRLHKAFDLLIRKEIKDKDFLFPPLLLIILVENAFKHGIEPAEGPCFLHIDIICDENKLSFSCENTFENTEEQAEKGIGLDNLRRRLALLFPEQHHFSISKNENSFSANLQIWKS
ncbi:MAG: histidine kinase [Saprospiraceae bacterium]